MCRIGWMIIHVDINIVNHIPMPIWLQMIVTQQPSSRLERTWARPSPLPPGSTPREAARNSKDPAGSTAGTLGLENSRRTGTDPPRLRLWCARPSRHARLREVLSCWRCRAGGSSRGWPPVLLPLATCRGRPRVGTPSHMSPSSEHDECDAQFRPPSREPQVLSHVTRGAKGNASEAEAVGSGAGVGAEMVAAAGAGEGSPARATVEPIGPPYRRPDPSPASPLRAPDAPRLSNSPAHAVRAPQASAVQTATPPGTWPSSPTCAPFAKSRGLGPSSAALHPPSLCFKPRE